MNLCKDCKFFSHDFMRYGATDGLRTYYASNCSFLVGKEHPVSGDIIESPVECSAMRLGPCTLSGVLFEPKPLPPSPL